MRKYEITDIAHPHNPILKRIRALRPFYGVAEGDLGGYVDEDTSIVGEFRDERAAPIPPFLVSYLLKHLVLIRLRERH